MKAVEINNFVDGCPIEVSCNHHDTIGPLVTLIQNAGSVRFQHTMTPSQARDMGVALLAMADAIEEVAA